MNAIIQKSMRTALIILLTTTQAYGAPTCNQVVCADVVKSQKVATNKLCVSGDANFGGDVTIDGDLTVHGDIINEISPIEGWWLNTLKGNISNTTVLWHIYHVGSQLRVHLYAGYQGRYREWTPEDFAAVALDGVFLFAVPIPVNDVALLKKNEHSYIVNPVLPGDPEYLSPYQNTNFLNTTSNPNILYYYGADVPNDSGGDFEIDVLRLVRLAQAPEIETFDNPAFIDNTNPINILENIYNMLLRNGNPQFAVDFQASDYPGFAAFTARKDQLLSTGVQYQSVIKDVWRTRLDDPTGLGFPLSTTFITTQHANPRLGARAVVTGFSGDYALLNNATGWQVGVADNDNGRDAAQVYGPEYYVGSQQKSMLTIVGADSSDLPVYNPLEHGVGQVTVIVDPVTATSQYAPLTAAAHDLQSYAGRSTHTNLNGYYNGVTNELFDSFEDLQTGFDNDTAAFYRIRSRGYHGTRAGDSYVDIDANNIPTFPSIPSNDPTGITLYDGESPTAFYSIDIFNYLDPERTFNIYWALDGAPIPDAPVTTQKLVDITQDFYGPGQPYYKTPGSQFIFQVDNYYNNSAFGNTPPDPAVWSIYNAGSYNDFNNLVFGILDESKTCGETVAYISLLDDLSIDPIYLASSFPEFAPNGTYYPQGPLADCFALVMETLKQYNPTSYVINNRGNGGGYSVMVVLSSFFGADRSFYTEKQSFAGNGYQPSQPIQQTQDEAQFENLQESINNRKFINTNAFAAAYPNAMVRDEGTKVYFITDTNAGSYGDVNTHLFRNNDAANFGDLGFGVESIIIGDIDGRLFGAASIENALFTNNSQNTSDEGIPVGAFSVRLEAISALTRAGENAYLFANQNPVVAPDLLFNMDIENTFWLDVGSKGTYPLNPIDGGTDPLVLPLSTGVTQPVYGTNVLAQATWRDRVLEAAIMMAVPEGCFTQAIRNTKEDTKAKEHKAKLAKHLAARAQQKPDPKRKRLGDKY